MRSYLTAGLTKLIMSYQAQETLGAGMHFIEDPRELKKSAATIFGCDYADMMPDKNHVGIHVVGLGDYETYGMNRNGDTFPKIACVRYHDTFVKNGHVFRNHVNKDPAGKLGDIVKSAFNHDMGRVELFLHVNKETARNELQKLATDGEHAFSMACRVPYDRCTVCNTLRKSAMDSSQCSHVRDELRSVRRDGTAVGTHNDTPTFFDISFVRRPADRTAWDLKMAMSEYETLDSTKLAEVEGIWIPDHLAFTEPMSEEKRKLCAKLADYEKEYLKFANNPPTLSQRSRYLWELRKAADTTLTDAQIDTLRMGDPADVMPSLSRAGIILSAPDFFKYAFGPDNGELAPHMSSILSYIKSGLFLQLEKSGRYQQACTNPYFDVDPSRGVRYSSMHDSGIGRLIGSTLAKSASFIGSSINERVIESTIDGRSPAVGAAVLVINPAEAAIIEKAAELYAAYKLSALQGVRASDRSRDEDVLLALTAVQDLVV